ncbi:MAG: tetratricopeptide repeat protein [Dinghuibacter sp.]|nr:tetratricopeptide repeat protein [Dinghuibacter sp.]
MHKFILLLLAVSAFYPATAQHTKMVNDELAQYKKAKELYTNGQFSLAYPLFKELQHSVRSTDRANQAVAVQDIDYYTAVCGLKQNDTNAVFAAQQFIELEANNPRSQMMAFHLANYEFRNQRFDNAIPLYEQANIANLSNDEISEMKFNLGYGYFTRQEFASAKPLFDAIRQIETDPHYLDAHYYYGFIAYYDRQFRPALESFRKVESHPDYGKVVPFYITEIYYFTGQKDKALSYGEEMLRRGAGYYDLEMRQLVGHGYFEKKEFAKALPYLEKYVTESEKVRREDIYELSYCYYQEKRWAKAIEGFKQLSGKEDSLSQNSMYLLGDAYLRVNQKANARNAFAFCAANSSNEIQREISKFSYAKLSYELGYTDVALNEFRDFLNEFPNSTYTREARELLVDVLARTNNFREAKEQIEGLSNPSENTKKIYPRVLYGRAVELINDQDVNGAENLLDKILQDKYNAPVLSLTHFWKGEIHYRKDRLDESILSHSKYLEAPVTNGEVNPNHSKYTLGYAYLRKENYNRALGYFEGISRNAANSKNSIEQDAWLRTADCYFMNREYARAKTMYENAITNSWAGADYAVFQKAMVTGINNSNEKITQLKTIERRYPNSSLISDANLEIGTTYMADDKYRDAVPFLNTVLNTPGSASLKPRALLNLGIAYHNMNNDNEAINKYKTLVSEYPNAPEAEDAMENLEKIYVESGRAAEYADFMRGAGKPLSVSREDSLTYTAAERLYTAGDMNGALSGFEQYLNRFPNGYFSLNAQFYTSEIYDARKDFNRALPGYEAVAGRGSSRFAEKAAFQAARINYFELKNYAKAEQYFGILKTVAVTQENKLEAMRGLLRSQYYQQKYTEAEANAAELAALKGASADDKAMANLVQARAQQIKGNLAEAITKYKSVVAVNKAAFAAEARYEIAHCNFQLNKIPEAEKAAFEVVNKSGSYEIWLTKAYILLGDIYWKQKDYFNAKATYQSVADNATIAELKQEAQTKLAKVTEEEKAASKIGN